MRGQWTSLSDQQLLEQCALDTYRASGPGGQKRNKTSSAVRLRHRPSGIIVIAEESRSQHENRARALKRMRQALYLTVREDVPAEQSLVQCAMQDYCDAGGRLTLRRKDARFWPAVGRVLDVLLTVEARLSDAAKVLGFTTGNLVAFLRQDVKVWQQANELRNRFGHKPLKDS